MYLKPDTNKHLPWLEATLKIMKDKGQKYMKKGVYQILGATPGGIENVLIFLVLVLYTSFHLDSWLIEKTRYFLVCWQLATSPVVPKLTKKLTDSIEI